MNEPHHNRTRVMSFVDTPLVPIKDIFMDECWVTCPNCGYVNYHNVGPEGAPIADRPWGHRFCDSPGACPGYRIAPADDARVHTDAASFRKTGAIPKRWQRTNINMHIAALSATRGVGGGSK